MLKIILLSIVLIALSMAGMALSVLVRKNGRFPAYRVGHNRNMKKLGISCVKHDEIKCFRKLKDAECSSCGVVDTE